MRTMNEQAPEAQNFEHNRLNQLLGKIGLVYGSGMAEFGLMHSGLGVPLHRRSTLQESMNQARNELATIEAAIARSDSEIQE